MESNTLREMVQDIFIENVTMVLCHWEIWHDQRAIEPQVSGVIHESGFLQRGWPVLHEFDVV
jgi:hypothetical protein